MIYQTLLSAAVVACMLFSEPIVCLASTQNVAKLKDILCVLILNGVEKEDLDDTTLRKLEKLHVNINDLNNGYKSDCKKNIGSVQPDKNNDELWTTLMTELPPTSTIGLVRDMDSPNLINLPKLEEILNSFQTTVADIERDDIINEKHSEHGTTRSPKKTLKNNRLDNVLNFWNQLRQNNELSLIVSTTTAGVHKKHSLKHIVKNEQIEKPKMLYEDENASRLTEFVTNDNINANVQLLLPTSTTGEPIPNDKFNEYADFFNVMYKKFIEKNNQENKNHDMNGKYGFKNDLKIEPDFQQLSPQQNPTIIKDPTENTQIRPAPQEFGLEPLQRPYATRMNMPISIFQVKPIKINYMHSVTTKMPENNGTQFDSEAIKEIANELKTMLLTQLKKEIPTLTQKPTRKATEPPTTTMLPITTMTTHKVTTTSTTPQTSPPTKIETKKPLPASSETRKKIDETNGIVQKLFGLFQKLEVAQQNTFSSLRPMLGPAPAPGYLPLSEKVIASVVTSAPIRADSYGSGASKNAAMNNFNDRMNLYQNEPRMQYNKMQYSVLPPKPMSPYLELPESMSNSMRYKNNNFNPVENQYNYKMIKPSMVAINAKMIQTNEFIVMPLRVPINVEGKKSDVQRIIDNQNIILDNHVTKSTTATPTTTKTLIPKTTETIYPFPKTDRNYGWNNKKIDIEYTSNSYLKNSRERQQFIESLEHERLLESRDREKARYSSREGRDERTHEHKTKTRNHQYLPRSHFNKVSHLLSARDQNYDRLPSFQSDENPIHPWHHEGPKYPHETIYPGSSHKHIDGNRYREKVNYHPHSKIVLDNTREAVREDTNYFRDKDPARDEIKFHNHEPERELPVREETNYFRDKDPARDEIKFHNHEPERELPMLYNRELPLDDPFFNRDPSREESHIFNREQSRDQPNFFNKAPRREPKMASRELTRQPKEKFNQEAPRNKYDAIPSHDARDRADTFPELDSFEKLMKGDSGENKGNYEHRPIAPINNPPTKSKFSEKHFKNFLSTQQKVNNMLEKILTAKTQGARI